MTTVRERVDNLRRLMREQGIEAYLVPGSDPHQDEYVPDFWQRRRYITGFTGSAGEAAITLEKAGLWTDSRYFIQAEEQLDGEIYSLFKMGLPDTLTIREWLSKELVSGQTIGIDPRVITQNTFKELEAYLQKNGLAIRCISENLVDKIWEDRPIPPKHPIFIHDEIYAGSPVSAKLKRLREKMEEEAAKAHIISKLDSLAWLYNIRGGDIEYNPVAIAFGLVTAEKALLFIDTDKVPENVRSRLEPQVRIEEYNQFADAVRELRGAGSVWVDEPSVSRWILDLLAGTEVLMKPGPIDLFKAVKNSTETDGMRRAHIRDGAAMVKFLHWLEKSLGHKPVTEISAARKAEEFRQSMDLFKGMSFETISSFGSHGAVVHYSVTPDTDIPIAERGIYLIDSGGQYLDGTTDITRTIAVGPPTEEEKDRFTRVLKGLISLSSTAFPKGTVGKQLDTLARRPLWDLGLNFLHGTGHGLGHYLNVHEGPQAISYYRCIGIALEPGMISTIEPGYYKEDHYGMRVENAVLVVNDEELSVKGQEFFRFETLTLCPIDRSLILPEMLSPEEKGWLNGYHARVRETLSPLLAPEEATWLETATAPI